MSVEPEFIVETEFLLGLRPRDKFRNVVSRIMSGCRERGLSIHYTVSAIIEIRGLLYSIGREPSQVHRAIAHLKAKILEKELGEVPLQMDDVILADKLRADESSLTYFDALHAATAIRTAKTLISNDPVYSRLGVEVLTMKEALKALSQRS